MGVIRHEITLEDLENQTDARMAKEVMREWEGTQNRGFGTPKIDLQHIEITHEGQESDHIVTVLISFQGSCSKYQWAKVSPGHDASMTYSFISEREIIWMDEARIAYQKADR